MLADRFRIEAEAGAGGMGVVYRAHDQRTGETVALKVLAQNEPLDASRFDRERAILAELHHPGIVRYVDHGRDGGAPWLAMEWLDGETLAARVRRGPLPVRDAVRIVRDAATAIGRAHAAGIVHRDLKPANLFLVRGAPERVSVLDFGIARRTGGVASTLTTTGTVLGTPYYMAPEQARGGRELDPRIDVYALGAVLYESLTGARPFEHESVVAVLAAVMLEEPPSPRELVAAVPEALDALVLAMMSKRAELRPSDGSDVGRLLGEMLEDESSLRASTMPSRRGLTGREQRVVCVVLVEGAFASAPDGRTLDASRGEDIAGRVRAVVEPIGGEVVALADGSLVVALDASGAATDQAARAARCALAIREALPSLAIAITAGRAMVTGRVPVGEVVQRGADLLGTSRVGIRVDDVAIGLLDGRFRVSTEDGVAVLEGLDRTLDVARDTETPALLGRERELAQLDALYQEARGEPIARAAIVGGAPGSGKSRLLEAFLARVGADARIVWVRADPLAEHAPFALAAEIVRQAAGIADGDPLAERRRKLVDRVGPDGPSRVAVMLGELCRAPFDLDADPVLAGVRRDPVLRGDLERRAFEDWIALECARGPLVLAVDDARYVDRATLGLLDDVLRLHETRPLVVILAGPSEPDEASLWIEREPMRCRLGRLLPRAARALVLREIGAAEASAQVVDRVLERGDGNPRHLEELARAVRDGETELPTSVLAMVEARLAVLSADARRVARAASVFGPRAPEAGVRVLVGARPIEDALADLSARDVLARDRRAQTWLAWGQPLLCDAAYAMLTDEDRTLGHRMAGEWLAANGEVEPSVLARHFEIGGARSVAARSWSGAAELALAANDLGGARAHAEHGLSCSPDDDTRGSLLATLAESHRWKAEYTEAFARAEEALRFARAPSSAFFAAASTFVSAALRLGRADRIAELATQLERLDGAGDEAPSLIALLCRVASHDLATHDDAAFERRMARASELESALARPDPIARAWVRTLRASRAYETGALDAFVEGTAAAADDYALGGDARDACNQRVRLAHGWLALGEPARAEAELTLALDDARRMGLRLVEGYALQNLGHARARSGQHAEAARTLARAIDVAQALNDAMLEAGARVYLSELALETGQTADAAREATLAIALTSGHFLAIARAALARALARTGDAHEAATLARAAREAVPEDDAEADAHVALAMAESAAANERSADAQSIAAAALARVRRRADRITSVAWRAAYLERVPQHVVLARIAQGQ